MSHLTPIFNPSPKIRRSPVKKLDNSPMTEMKCVDDLEHLSRKRKIEEINDGSSKHDDLDDVDQHNDISNKHLSNQLKTLFDLIASTSRMHSEEISSAKTDLTKSMHAISDKVNQIEANVSSLQSNVQDIDKKVDIVSKTADLNKKLINIMMQENLSKCMDIDGIDRNVVEKATNLKSLALEVISSFNIIINTDDIDRVSKKELRKEENGDTIVRFILLVHFKDFETKVRVLRTKMSIKDGRNIYFNATLTPTNRFFMRSAKKLAKKANLKVFFKSGKVNVEKTNKEIITIASESDISVLESYVTGFQNNQQAHQSRNNI